MGHFSPTHEIRPVDHHHNLQPGLGDRRTVTATTSSRDCVTASRSLPKLPFATLPDGHERHRHLEGHGQSADQWERTVPTSGSGQVA